MMDFGNTPVETLEKHYQVAKQEGLKYAYLGNVPGHPLEHTYCPECKSVVIERYGFSIDGWNLDDNNCCKNCSYPIPIVGKLHNARKKNRFQFIH
jgi:pyruvate formate lyase activating enzyme